MELPRSTMRKLLLLITFAALLFTAHQWLDDAQTLLAFLGSVLSPFLIGAAMAFILNVPMRFLENRLFTPISARRVSGKKKPLPFNLVRGLSLVLTFLLVIVILLLLMLVVLPQLAVTISGLGATIQNAFTRFFQWAQLQFANNPQAIELLELLNINWQDIDWAATISSVIDFLKNGAGNMLTSTISAAKGVVSTMTKFMISLVFAIYLLLQKEKLSLQFRKAAFALLPKKAADHTLRVCALSNRIFSSFITGQCLEAVILGTMFFVTMTLLKMPYALLVGCLIAVTALIPIMGAFIGCFVGAFLLLMVSPMQALIFLVTFFVLQQIEGNLIYPHVVGSSVGLPSIWVLAAVTVGGSLMGVVGMLLFIPLVSVLYTLFREFVYQRLKTRNIEVQ